MKDTEQGITGNIGWTDRRGIQPTKRCSFPRQSLFKLIVSGELPFHM